MTAVIASIAPAQARQQWAVFHGAVDGDDGYCAMVRAILKGAVGEPSAAQRDIAVCIAGLFQAVPAWMLKLGTTTNKGCSAVAGLQTFQVTPCSHAWHMYTNGVPLIMRV